MNVRIDSGIKVTYAGDRPEIDYINADLLLFPKVDFIQEVLDLETRSSPLAKFDIQEDNINYRWSGADIGNIDFSINSRVKVDNKFRRVKDKIRFPLERIDPGYLIYTKPSDKIDINKDIEQKAFEIVQGEDDLYIAVYKLADWVNRNIKYDLNTLTAEAVQQSSWVLDNREGVCDELTNLFISFLRSLGIPARFVSGLVYSNLDYKWGPHGWAEVYFPGQGWVPFDVTFGQYGWVDPSHVKLQTSLDSGNPSIEYRWRARDIDISTKEIGVSASLVSKESKLENYVELNLEPLVREAGFGSYIPIVVSVENLKDFYVPVNIFVSKAPELVEPSVGGIILRPNEIRTISWIAKVPDELDRDYIYNSVIEIMDNFGNVESGELVFSRKFKNYGLDWAEENVKGIKERAVKNRFEGLDFSCSLDRSKYYSGDKAIVKCSLRNDEGGVLKVCLLDQCKDVSLEENKESSINFDLVLSKSGRIVLSAENLDSVEYSYISFEVIGIPKVEVRELEPRNISYGARGDLSFDLYSYELAKDIKVSINGLRDVEVEELSGRYKVIVPFKGSNFPYGEIKMHLVYYDEIGKKYEDDLTFVISVRDLPWHYKMLRWFRDLV